MRFLLDTGPGICLWRQQLAEEFEHLRARTLADLQQQLATFGFSLTVA